MPTTGQCRSILILTLYYDTNHIIGSRCAENTGATPSHSLRSAGAILSKTCAVGALPLIKPCTLSKTSLVTSTPQCMTNGACLMRQFNAEKLRKSDRLKSQQVHTQALLVYRMESFPRKSRWMVKGSVSFKCSTRSEQHPTVSASSSVSFSPPTRRASLSMK